MASEEYAEEFRFTHQKTIVSSTEGRAGCKGKGGLCEGRMETHEE